MCADEIACEAGAPVGVPLLQQEDREDGGSFCKPLSDTAKKISANALLCLVTFKLVF